MSVMEMREEIKQVCDALYWDALGSRQYIHTVCDYPIHPCSTTIDNDKEQISAWCNRLYVANQCAYIFTYSHRADCDRKINMLDGECWNSGDVLIRNPARFFRMLESIKYNLYSNGGQVMLCREDMEKLDALTAILAREVVGEYQKGKAGVR